MTRKKPDPTLVAVAKAYRELEVLRKQQAATIAELIRACVTTMSFDVNSYRVRGYESYSQKQEIIAENKRDKAAAPLYLLSLATHLENYAGVYNDTPSGSLTVSSARGE